MKDGGSASPHYSQIGLLPGSPAMIEAGANNGAQAQSEEKNREWY